METKVFSVKDGTLIVNSGNLFLCEDRQDEVPIATTFEADTNGSVYIIPSSLIRKPKTDEELAEEFKKKVIELNDKAKLGFTDEYFIGCRTGYFEGRKSVGGGYSKNDMISFAKWLQKEDTLANAESWFHYTDSDMFEYWLKEIHSKAIYPTTITVEHDGEKYYWETLKAEY